MALMEQFYGVKAPEDDLAQPGANDDAGDLRGGDDGPKPSHGPAAFSDPSLDLDSPQLDARAFVRQQLRQKDVAALAAQSIRLSQEQQGLLGGVQELVYANYRRFLGAASTVRDVRGAASGIGEATASLGGQMERLAATSGQVDGALKRRRTEVARLLGQ